MDTRERQREQEKAKAFVRGLSQWDVGELGDQLVLDAFDWRDWGFERKPSAVFMNAMDEARIHREITDPNAESKERLVAALSLFS